MRGEWDRALRVSQRLLDSALTDAEKTVFLDCAASNLASVNIPGALLGAFTLDQTRACVIYAETVAHFEASRGAALLQCVHRGGVNTLASTATHVSLDSAVSHKDIRVAMDGLVDRFHNTPVVLASGDRM